ncbi:MAG: M24 family metallopeptidase [Chloroflexota bacterium]|nr:M24 family metallopeptidase [Chloroflexota bacterium]
MTAVTFDPEHAISADEFRGRQSRARAAAAELGLDGLMVWSRGGGPVDMSADVVYLANHYSQQPYMADHAGIGRARSHGVLVLPVNGPSILVMDVPWWRPELVIADEVRTGNDVISKAADAMRSAGLAAGRVGLVGASHMTAAAYLGLVQALPALHLIRTDELVERLRIYKSAAEVVAMRAAIALGDEAVKVAMAAAVVGATEADCAAEAAAVVARGAGVLYDAACASGAQAHNFTWARMPSSSLRPLERGDMFHMDCYGALAGYFWDFGRTRIAGDEPTDQQRALVEAAIGVVDAVCTAIRPGVTAAEAYAAGAHAMAESAVIGSMPVEQRDTEGFPAVGHGIGLGWEAPWLTPVDHTVLVPGMTIAVETLVGHPSMGGGFFEENGVVTETGFEVLTSAQRRWW